MLIRAQIKLWNQGTRTKGAAFNRSNGLVYPTISGVLYVEWRYIEEGDPDLVGQRYAGRVMGDGDTAKKWRSLYLTDRMFERTDVTHDTEVSGIKIYAISSFGLEIFQIFLIFS